MNYALNCLKKKPILSFRWFSQPTCRMWRRAVERVHQISRKSQKTMFSLVVFNVLICLICLFFANHQHLLGHHHLDGKTFHWPRNLFSKLILSNFNYHFRCVCLCLCSDKGREDERERETDRQCLGLRCWVLRDNYERRHNPIYMVIYCFFFL